MLSLRQIAERQNVSYEAIRKQVVRYEEELKGHISVKNRTQYLDDWAVEFLQNRRRESPIIIVGQEKEEEMKNLKDQVETLRTQLLEVQKELLKSREEHLKAQDRIIELQEESRTTLEARIKYTALLEDNKAKEAKLTEAKSQIEFLKTTIDGVRKDWMEDQKTIEDLQKEHAEDQEQIEGLWKDRKEDQEALEKVLNLREADQKKIEDLQRERDEALSEAQSFKRSIFGFYRKR